MNACDTSSGQNPDGSKVLVAFANATDKTVSVTVPVGEALLQLDVSAKSINTVVMR